MTPKEFASLGNGDKIWRSNANGKPYAITEKCGSYVIGVRVVHISDPSGWKIGEHPVDSIGDLHQGLIVQAVDTGNTYVITSVHGEFVLAAETAMVVFEEAAEWSIAGKAHFLF